MTQSTAAATRKEVVGYAIGSVGTGGFGVLPGLVLSYYLTDTLGVAALLAGLIVTIPKIWDVVIDPFIGNFSDADARRRRSRRPVMLAGAVTLPVCFFLVFAAPAHLSSAAAGIWVIVTFMIATTAFSMFQVPYISLPAELAGTPRARTAFVGGGPGRRAAAGGAHRGCLVRGAVAGAALGAGMIIATLLTTPKAAPAGGGLGTEIRAAALNALRVFRNAVSAVRESRHLPPLLTAFVLQALAAVTMLAAAPYLATYILRNEGAASILFVALVAPALALMPLARRLADRVGKRRAFAVATLVFAVGAGSMMLLFLHAGPWVYAS